MLINIDIDENELKTKILDGLPIDTIMDEAVKTVKYDLQSKVECAIRKTKEFKETSSFTADDKRMKAAIQKMADEAVLDKLKAEIKTYVVLESKLPKIVKSYVNDFLHEYVEEELQKQIRKIYSVKIGVIKNEVKEDCKGKKSTESNTNEEVEE